MLRNTVSNTLKRILNERRKNTQVLLLSHNKIIFLDKDIEDIVEYLEVEWENKELEEKKIFLKKLNVKSITQWQKFKVN